MEMSFYLLFLYVYREDKVCVVITHSYLKTTISDMLYLDIRYSLSRQKIYELRKTWLARNNNGSKNMIE